MGQWNQYSSDCSPTRGCCHTSETFPLLPPDILTLETKAFLHFTALKELEFLCFAFMFTFPVFVLGLTAVPLYEGLIPYLTGPVLISQPHKFTTTGCKGSSPRSNAAEQTEAGWGHKGSRTSPCSADGGSSPCQLVRTHFFTCHMSANLMRKESVQWHVRVTGHLRQQRGFRCLKQIHKDTVAKHREELNTSSTALICPQTSSKGLGQREFQRMLRDGFRLWAQRSQPRHHLWLAKRSPRETSQHLNSLTPLQSQDPARDASGITRCLRWHGRGSLDQDLTGSVRFHYRETSDNPTFLPCCCQYWESVPGLVGWKQTRAFLKQKQAQALSKKVADVPWTKTAMGMMCLSSSEW